MWARLTKTHNTRIDLFLMGEIVAALSANDPDVFKRCLLGGVQDLGKPRVEEHDRLTGWHLGEPPTLLSFTRTSPEADLFPTKAMYWGSPEGL